MKRKKSPWEERRSTREAVGQIASWCLIIALHQTEGVGRERLERVSGVVSGIQCEIAAIIDEEGTEAGIRALQKRLEGIGPTEMRVPGRLPVTKMSCGTAASVIRLRPFPRLRGI